MTDLFDYAAAQAAKAEGMARAADNAAAGWTETMYALVIEVARARRRFTSDDVYRLAEERAVPPTPEGRAFGQVMLRAARNGVCKKADCAPVPSARRSLHASPRAVWDSLVLTEGASQ
jgi:hypothetical protein